jgi:hypothetical protein
MEFPSSKAAQARQLFLTYIIHHRTMLYTLFSKWIFTWLNITKFVLQFYIEIWQIRHVSEFDALFSLNWTQVNTEYLWVVIRGKKAIDCNQIDRYEEKKRKPMQKMAEDSVKVFDFRSSTGLDHQTSISTNLLPLSTDLPKNCKNWIRYQNWWHQEKRFVKHIGILNYFTIF